MTRSLIHGVSDAESSSSEGESAECGGSEEERSSRRFKLLPFTFYQDQHAVRDHMHDMYTWRNKRVFNLRGSVEYTSLSRLYISHHFFYLLSYRLSVT